MAEEQLKEAAQRLAEFETEMLGIIHVETWIMHKLIREHSQRISWTIYIYILGIYPWYVSIYIYIYQNHEIWISSMRPGQALP